MKECKTCRRRLNAGLLIPGCDENHYTSVHIACSLVTHVPGYSPYMCKQAASKVQRKVKMVKTDGEGGGVSHRRLQRRAREPVRIRRERINNRRMVLTVSS